ncbi:MAG: nuclear transport factor 2 family protein [Cyanobacteria bacterium P01_H01_bin.74]
MTTASKPAIKPVVDGFMEKLNTNDFMGAIRAFYDDTIESVEPGTGSPEMPKIQKGIEAIIQKNEWWMENHEIHQLWISEPMIGSTQFAICYRIDVTFKPTGTRTTSEEVAVYTVENGKIIKEMFFYDTAGQAA